jgi:hypothetical protein
MQEPLSTRCSKNNGKDEFVQRADVIWVTCADGVAVRLGNKVEVVYLADDTVSGKYLGRVGIVLAFDFDCGCGQSYPDDPMIKVLFENSCEEFWREEIRLVESDLNRRAMSGRLPP